MDAHLLQAVKDSGYEGDDDSAQLHFDELEDTKKSELNQAASDSRIAGRVSTSLEPVMKRVIHSRLNELNVPPTSKHNESLEIVYPETKPKETPDSGKEKPTIVVPEGYVKVEELDKFKNEIKTRDIRTACADALRAEGVNLMPGAFEDALAAMMRTAKMLDDRSIVIERTVRDNGEDVVRQESPKSAVEALRASKKFMFAGEPADGTGGGGSDASKAGSSNLPSGATYRDLLNDADLMARYLDENPEGFEKLKAQHYGTQGGDLQRTLRGEGVDAHTLVQRELARRKREMTTPQL